MAKISRNIVVLAGVVFCAAFLAGISSAKTKGTATEEQVENPYEDSRILVEAFVVKVKLSALYSSKVNPIDRRLNSASMTKIRKCLEKNDNGKIIIGTKVVSENGNPGKMKDMDRVYTPYERKMADGRLITEYRWSENSIEFATNATIGRDGKVGVDFSFVQKIPKVVSSKDDKLSAEVVRSWNGFVCLEAGKPSIVGATQNEETAVFLIICADIEK